ncbi:farnesyltransferase/geranylgeranyltransferase [Thraustotheca clavata]|uniref:Farnesyltransferase/geranylgeranyltransferase n=1 Tax=Thraustotheca clavata TaxID=74557 RepID=A0A1V9YY27_9STRA|nr:farnesyltransferase/geranylgeranyltransferase [Thraustotheca clavata]
MNKRKDNKKKSSREQLEQDVLKHHAKTVYFNGLWKDFLTKACVMVGGVALYHTYALFRDGNFALHFGMVFEIISFALAMLSLLFLHRLAKPLVFFKLGFSLMLLQCGWYSLQIVNLRWYHIKGELTPEQIPMGAMCFIVTWASDRYMIRSESIAQNATQAVEHITKKLE